MTSATPARRRSCTQRSQLGSSCIAGATLAVLLAPAPAQACTFHEVRVGATYPRYEQHNVPTNAVLFVDGAAIGEHDPWLRDDADHDVPIEVRAVEASGFDIEPVQPLTPSRSYVLGVRHPEGAPTTIPFTTGIGPADVPSVLLTPQWAPVQVRYDTGTCVDRIGYCTGSVGQPGTVLEVRSGPIVLWYSGNEPLSGTDARWQAGDCLSARARDIRGNRSEPVIACGDDIQKLDLGAVPFAPDAEQSPDCAAIAPVPGEAPAREIVPTSEQETNAVASSGCALGESSTTGFRWLAWSLPLVALLRRRRGSARGLGWALLLSIAQALLPAPARACTRAFPTFNRSYPVGYSGERVPTNAVLFADGPRLTAQGFTLTDAAGNSIPIQVRAVAAGGFDVEPVAELAPNQDYVLSVPEDPAQVANSISFHTDSGPAKVPDALITPEWSPIAVAYNLANCPPDVLFCTGASVQPDTMLEFRIGRESLTAGPEGTVSRALGGGLDEDECMSVRARDLRGHRSEPAIACGEAIRRYDAGSPATFNLDCTAIAASFAEPAAQNDGSAPAAPEAPPVPTDVAGAASERVTGGGCALHAGEANSGLRTLALGAALIALSRRRSRPAP